MTHETELKPKKVTIEIELEDGKKSVHSFEQVSEFFFTFERPLGYNESELIHLHKIFVNLRFKNGDEGFDRISRVVYKPEG